MASRERSVIARSHGLVVSFRSRLVSASLDLPYCFLICVFSSFRGEASVCFLYGLVCRLVCYKLRHCSPGCVGRRGGGGGGWRAAAADGGGGRGTGDGGNGGGRRRRTAD